MRPYLDSIASAAATGLEAVGVLLIVGVTLAATVAVVARYLRGAREGLYKEYRHRLARGILLGLELLVGADIINTVALDLTPGSVAVLAAVVAIRTFLSFSLEVELTGRWPWQHHEGGSEA